MEKKMIKSNYNETRQRLAQFILDRIDPELIRSSELESLKAVARGDEDRVYGLEFRKDAVGLDYEGRDGKMYAPECSATLYVDLECDWDNGRIEDENGDLYRKYRVKAAVSWASWGSTEAKLAKQRLALMNQVCALSEEIDTNFQDAVYQLWATKADIEEGRRKAEVAKAIAFYTAQVTSNAYRMLVGQQRVVQLPGHVGQWEGLVEWPRPNGDVWQFMTKVNDAHCIFTRTENKKS
jgi:hypothetical protein